MEIKSIYLNDLHLNFFEKKCINVSKYMRNKIESDPEYREWKEKEVGYKYG